MVLKCYLFISEQKPFLGSSPDGLLGDELVIEVKCPFTAKDKKISHETVEYVTENDELKKQHDYFYQVQGRVYCTGRKKAKLIICSLSEISKLLTYPETMNS